MKQLGQRVGRAMAAHFISGDGSGKPRGIVPAATVGASVAGTNVVTVDDVVTLQFSVDPAYQDNAKWLMSANTFSAIRKLKDSTGRPLYGDLSSQAPGTLLGHKVVLDAGVPALATGLRPIL